MHDFIFKNPRSLYQCCVEYIASHLNMVESLVGFPEIMGRAIFKTAMDANNSDLLCFKTYNTRNCIQIFFDAYGEGDILNGLSLERAHVFLNDVIDDCWFLFQHLSHLDLSSCGIGDAHDILTNLEGMLRLQTLVLRDNLLTDEGIRKLTIKQRMHRKSSSLKFFDLSYNHGITVRSVSFLRHLPHLSLLNVSHTGLTCKDAVLLDYWQVCTGQDVCPCMTSRFLVSTEGWATDLLNSWKLQIGVPETKAVKLTESSTVSRFYSRTMSTTVTKASNTYPAHESHKKVSPCVLKSHLFSCEHFKPHIPLSPHCHHEMSLNQKTLNQNVTSERVFTNNRCQKYESKTVCSYSEYEDEASVLLQYRRSPPKKKMKGSLLQQLEDFL